MYKNKYLFGRINGIGTFKSNNIDNKTERFLTNTFEYKNISDNDITDVINTFTTTKKIYLNENKYQEFGQQLYSMLIQFIINNGLTDFADDKVIRHIIDKFKESESYKEIEEKDRVWLDEDLDNVFLYRRINNESIKQKIEKYNYKLETAYLDFSQIEKTEYDGTNIVGLTYNNLHNNQNIKLSEFDQYYEEIRNGVGFDIKLNNIIYNYDYKNTDGYNNNNNDNYIRGLHNIIYIISTSKFIKNNKNFLIYLFKKIKEDKKINMMVKQIYLSIINKAYLSK